MTTDELDGWGRTVLRACCETLQDSIDLGKPMPNLAAAGVRLMLAGYTSTEIELFKVCAEQARTAIMEGSSA